MTATSASRRRARRDAQVAAGNPRSCRGTRCRSAQRGSARAEPRRQPDRAGRRRPDASLERLDPDTRSRSPTARTTADARNGRRRSRRRPGSGSPATCAQAEGSATDAPRRQSRPQPRSRTKTGSPILERHGWSRGEIEPLAERLRNLTQQLERYALRAELMQSLPPATREQLGIEDVLEEAVSVTSAVAYVTRLAGEQRRRAVPRQPRHARRRIPARHAACDLPRVHARPAAPLHRQGRSPQPRHRRPADPRAHPLQPAQALRLAHSLDRAARRRAHRRRARRARARGHPRLPATRQRPAREGGVDDARHATPHGQVWLPDGLSDPGFSTARGRGRQAGRDRGADDGVDLRLSEQRDRHRVRVKPAVAAIRSSA